MPRLQRLDHARKRVRARVCVRAGARQIDHTMHMPERGFREHTLAAMAELLAGLSERGLHVVTLSELDAMASGARGQCQTIKIESRIISELLTAVS